ncbi:hypothetical protein FE257_003122 [Aspergillus nanangensis]|uniref:SAP domain-containing protein n=1 Tax=Aspergillus nanangensis TaxID=2582783 RepID=A0AAD4GNP9_ASPNN|nr:hypothetical protein FE257_003122 [Aspergillus nanangensis]
MATDYSKKTNPELVEILKSRSLPHTGKKADMVARLQEDDKTKTETAPAPAATKTDNNAEDVIDWEDDEVPAADAAAATAAADGKGAASNPPAASNQQVDTNAATTDAPNVESQGAAAGQEGTEAAPVEEKPPVDYSIGLPITEMEEELKKRKARAEKFGITADSNAAIEAAEKKLERAKRFGTDAATEETAEEKASVGVSRLDEALSSEKSRKRGRGDNNDHGARGGKRRDFGGRNRGRRQGPGNRNPRGQGQGQGQGQKTGGNSNGGMSEKDRSAMESRKKRFGTAA